MSKAIIIDNFLDHPHLWRLKGLTTKYYNRDNHPDKTAINGFPGLRSEDISDKTVREKSFAKIQKYFIDNNIPETPIWGQTNFRLNHSLTFEHTLFGYHYDNHIHADNPRDNMYLDNRSVDKTYAGIIYLNPGADKTYGTNIITGESKYLVENIFNRFVIYSGTTMHTLAGSWGTNRFNARMVMTVFLQVSRNE
tara:strand:- start:1096 stop:1677 length:582 start_codon:yes stop_codon:yes gene_type:complete